MSGTAGGRCCAGARAAVEMMAKANKLSFQPEAAFILVICVFTFFLSMLANPNHNRSQHLHTGDAAMRGLAGALEFSKIVSPVEQLVPGFVNQGHRNGPRRTYRRSNRR